MASSTLRSSRRPTRSPRKAGSTASSRMAPDFSTVSAGQCTRSGISEGGAATHSQQDGAHLPPLRPRSRHNRGCRRRSQRPVLGVPRPGCDRGSNKTKQVKDEAACRLTRIQWQSGSWIMARIVSRSTQGVIRKPSGCPAPSAAGANGGCHSESGCSRPLLLRLLLLLLLLLLTTAADHCCCC
jgi:hypothetical protein